MSRNPLFLIDPLQAASGQQKISIWVGKLGGAVSAIATLFIVREFSVCLYFLTLPSPNTHIFSVLPFFSLLPTVTFSFLNKSFIAISHRLTMSLVSQQQLLQNQLQLKQLENQRNKQAQQTKSIVSSTSTNATVSASVTSNVVKHDSITTQSNNKSINSKYSRNPTKSRSDPLSVMLPTTANPTEILASRFNSWRLIISSLSNYLKEIVSVHEEITRQQIRLHHAISFPFLTQGLDGELYQPLRVSNQNQATHQSTAASAIFHPSNTRNDQSSIINDPSNLNSNNEFDLAKKFFLPLGSGSIQDLPTILYQYHSNAALLAQSTVKELNSTIIPRLEDLKRDLLVKIKEIKSLQTDFNNQVGRYQSETARLLSTYIKSIDLAKQSPSQLDPKNDPYLIKFALDRSIKRQLTEENYLHEAFINIQTSGKELEKVVYIELQTALTVYAKLLGQQAQNVFDGLISKLDSTLLTKEPSIEWDSFVERDHTNFIDLDLPMRKYPDIKYKYQSEPLNYEIKSGFLERKSKFLKSYQRNWYVLTSCFLHEFKSNDRRKDPVPERSLPLNELTVTEHSRRDEKNPNSYHKFVILHGQGSGLLHKGHNWVFRAESYDLMMAWYNDIKKLTQMSGPSSRSVIAGERRRSGKTASTIFDNTSAGTSIITSKRRERGVSSATFKTDSTDIATSNFETLNESPSLGNRTNRNGKIDQMKSMHLNSQQTEASSLSTGMMDTSEVILVPIKNDLSDSSNATKINSIIQEESHPYNAAASLAEQQAILLQQQAILEQKQRQLIEEQRELQQRAFSLTSSVQQQQQQQQQQTGVESPKIGGFEKIAKPVENLSEKVGELSVDESK